MKTYISECHQAPVIIRPNEKPKYICSECGQPCIPQEVRGENTSE